MNTAAHALIYNPSRRCLIPVPESARRQSRQRRTRRSHPVTVAGSAVLADRDLDVIAGRDVNLRAAENRFTEDYRVKSSGSSLALIPGAAPRQTLYGKTDMSQDSTASGNRATASLLSANGGDLTIIAGADASHAGTGRGNVTSEGADLLARQTVRIEGNAVSLLASDSRSQFDSVTKSKSVTVGAALAGTVGSLITRAYDMAEASRQGTGNRRLDNALALKAGYDGWKAYDNFGKALAVEADGAAAADGAKGNGSAFGVSVSVGVSKMKSKTHEASHSQRGTSIQADNITVVARETDITAVGAKLQADDDITLDAQRNIDLLAAVNTEEVRNRSKGSNTSLGVTVGIGQQTGISIQIGASQMKGKADGEATTYDNTEIVAGKTLTLKSGQDTTLKGAQVAGERVVANIGGNLSIETLQDQSRYKSKQSESGFSVSLCIPPICYGASSGMVSASGQKIDHSYRSAQGQSGIAAGTDGFEINVGGNTHLKGAAISSQAEADKNTLTTGSLSYEDLTNTQHTEASGSSFSISGGTDISKSLLPTASNSLAGQAAGNLLGNLAAQNGLPEDNSESSQTLAVISPATITLTGNDTASREAAEELTQRDPATANQALTDTLTLQDAARIERELQEAKQNAAAANLIGQTVAGLIGDLADQMKKPIVDASRRIELDQRQAAARDGGPPLTHLEQYELNRLNGEGMTSEKAAQTLVDPAAQANYNNWGEGSLNKTILHGLAGIIQAKVGDGNALVGAAAGALNE
ncbi:MAG TPA: hypothetical protein GXX56_03350, partial [Rhodocyclaceae bacterium]|nr:hypothetical protein [Rhodocyclaceae bacterium]